MTFLKSLFSSRSWFMLALLATICLSGLLLLFAPQQLPVVHYKLVLTLLAGLVGYMLDRVLFPFAAPSSYLDDDWRNEPDADKQNDADFPVATGYGNIFCIAMLRQAMLIVGAMLAVGLGL